MKYLRIIFTILSAICLAALFPLGFFLSWVGILIGLVGAGVFFGLMLLCKRFQEEKEATTIQPLPPTPEKEDAQKEQENK